MRLEAGMAWQPAWSGPIGEPLPPALGPGFTFDSVESPWVGAGRVTVAWALGERDQLEARGAWLGERTSSGRVSGRLGFRDAPGEALEATPLRSALLDVSARLATAQVGWRRTLVAGNVSWQGLVGLRGGYLEEQATLTEWNRPVEAAFTPSPTVLARVENVLVAAEGGLAVRVALGTALTLEVEGRGFYGVAWRRAEVRDAALFAPGEHGVTLRETSAAYGGSIGASLALHLGRRWSLLAAWEGTLLAGLARVDGAIDASRATSGSLRPRLTDDSLWVHAAYVGLEVDL